jgi:hypothetical protein
MKTILFFLILVVPSTYLFSQGSLSFVSSHGYRVAYGTHDGDERFTLKEIPESYFFSCVNLDVFGFFHTRAKTELEKEIYKEDYPDEYKQMLDSLKSLTVILKNGFEIKQYKLNLEEYNLAEKAFVPKEKAIEYNAAGPMHGQDLGKRSKGRQCIYGGSLYSKYLQADTSLLFSEIQGLYFNSSKGELRRKFVIENKREAVKLENKDLIITILFNRLDNSGGIIKPRKVIYTVDDKIISSYGKDKTIDSLLAIAPNQTIPTESISSVINRNGQKAEVIKTESLEGEPEEKSVTNEQLMPCYPECEMLKTNMERHRCTQRLIVQRIQENFNMPDIAKELGCSGKIMVKFIVDENGYVGDIEILKGDYELLYKVEISAGNKLPNEVIHKAVIWAVNKLPRFNPGMNMEQPASVTYNVPIVINAD